MNMWVGEATQAFVPTCTPLGPQEIHVAHLTKCWRSTWLLFSKGSLAGFYIVCLGFHTLTQICTMFIISTKP